MKINGLNIANILGISHVALTFEAPLTLIAGDNGAGKSSLAECIRLALLQQAGRGIAYKKDWPALVREGQKKGGIGIGGEGWSVSVSMPAGAFKETGLAPKGSALACCLTPSLFAAMPSNERKAFATHLLQIDLSADAIAAKLKARDCDAAKVDVVAPILERRGAAGAVEHAKQQATEARGEWKAMTGETYGSDKAEGWLPTAPTAPDGTDHGYQLQIERIDAAIAEANQRIGAANAAASTIDGLSRRLTEAGETAKLHARRTNALNTARKALVEAQEALSLGRVRAEGVAPLPHWPCPECGTLLRQEPSGKALVSYTPPEVIANPEARTALPKLEAAVKLCETSVANAERDVKASDDAAVLKASLQDQLDGIPVAEVAVDVNALRLEISTRQDLRRTLVSQQTRIREAETARKTAEATRDTAAAAHRAVGQWTQIAELLEPDGIPGELLAAGIDPFNNLLEGICEHAGSWQLVQLRPDMGITYGGRVYGLCSESEKYRANVMLACAIANLSGLEFALFDGVDVLAPAARVELIVLLDRLVHINVISQAIALGTFKKPPSGLPRSWQTHWIEGGAIDVPETEETEAA